MAYAEDLKSFVLNGTCGFDPHPGHVLNLKVSPKEKIYSSVDDVVADVGDGATIMFGGFGGAGFANNLIQGVARRGSRNLSVISNNCGTGEGELGILFKNRQIRRVVAALKKELGAKKTV